MDIKRQGASGLEANIIKMLALVSLIVAAIVAGYITVNSGIFGGTAADAGADVSTVSTIAGEAEQPAGEAAPAPETATTATTPNTYEIKPNDSFATIAEQYNTSIARIVELNPNLDPQNLKPGTVINVP